FVTPLGHPVDAPQTIESSYHSEPSGRRSVGLRHSCPRRASPCPTTPTRCASAPAAPSRCLANLLGRPDPKATERYVEHGKYSQEIVELRREVRQGEAARFRTGLSWTNEISR